MMTATNDRPIDLDELRALLHVVVVAGAHADDLRRQVDSLTGASGPITFVELQLPTDVAAVLLPDGPLRDVPRVVDDAGNPVGELLVWLLNGRLSAVEYAWWSDKPPIALPPPRCIVFSGASTSENGTASPDDSRPTETGSSILAVLRGEGS